MTPEEAKAMLEEWKRIGSWDEKINPDAIARRMSSEKCFVLRNSEGEVDVDFKIKSRQELKILQCALVQVNKSEAGLALAKRLTKIRIDLETPKLSHDVCLNCKWRFLVIKNNVHHKNDYITIESDKEEFESDWEIGKVDCCLLGEDTRNWYTKIDIFDPPPHDCKFIIEHVVSQDKKISNHFFA
jgi:hypothetical protein